MILYPTTNLTNTSVGIVGFIQGINTYYMYGWLGNCIAMIVFFVALGSLLWSTNDFKRSFAASAVLTFIVTFILYAIEIVPGFTFYLTLTAAGAGIAFAGRKN